MDFKIGDEIIEQTPENQKKKSSLPTIIVIIISLVIGLTVFFISNAIFGDKTKTKETPQVEAALDVKDDIVQELYGYVTYGVNGSRNDKFIKEQSVTLDNFSNHEKFYYALQFAKKEDFNATGRVDKSNQKIYNIATSKVTVYMQKFFGNDVSFATSSVIKYPFDFQIENKNVGTLTYVVDQNGYDTVFTETSKKVVPKQIPAYYTELESAMKKSDGSIVLTEKIIYVTATPKNNAYDIYFYKDYAKTMLLEIRTNVTMDKLKTNPIEIKDFGERTATITYTFKNNLQDYYFYSSKIDN